MYMPLAGKANYDGKFKEIQPFYPSDAPDTVIHRALVSTKGRLDYESDTTHSGPAADSGSSAVWTMSGLRAHIDLIISTKSA